MKKLTVENNKLLLFYLDIDDCVGQACSGNGQCRDLVNDYECKCNSGFEGRDCENSKSRMKLFSKGL